MANTVKFGMVWQCAGTQTADLPDNINPSDHAAVEQYLLSIWDDIPLPEGNYVSGSDTLDDLVPIKVYPTEPIN